jgi:diguanylate cyclase (GGDEF)-like protein/PAS domain S-box-containing protein
VPVKLPWRNAHLNLADNSDYARQRLADDVLANLSEAVVVERGNRVVYVNAAFTRIFGYTAGEIIGARLRDFIVPELRQKEYELVAAELARFGFVSQETVRKSKGGGLVDVAFEARPLQLNGEKDGLIFTFRDIGERKRMEGKLQYDALHDTLTGLPNRALFLDRLSLAFSRRLRSRGQNCGVLFLDLDRFKEINDSLGHAAGDELLIAVAERLRASLRMQDTATRLGGDEFAILVEGILSISDIEHMAVRVLGAMEREFVVSGHSLHIGASIGVAMAGLDHLAPEMLIRDADFAMYRAKQAGGGRIEIFDKKLKVAVTRLQERELELRQALNKRQFEVWYQPICGLRTGKPQTVKLEGFDSLLCWRRADGSLASFRDLLPVAEETGLSISLGRETMEAVCSQLRNWTEALPQSQLTLAIHLTKRQFYHPDLIALVKRTLAASGADPARLLFEVGESAFSENPEVALELLKRLLGCNVRLAIDDFGSGLAPLSHLARLPIDVLKLDPRLTLAATSTGHQVAVLESLIHLGNELGMRVVAQGVETPEQLGALIRMGCELAQGPLISPALEPVAAQRLAELGSWKFAPEA